MSLPLASATTSQPHVLTIAGSDSGGGAGIQADLKTIAASGCYGSSVITGLTAQNTLGVQAVHEVPTDFVIKQLQAVYDDEPPSTIKLGMLTSSTTILALASFLRNLPARPPVILDPVMVSTSGHTLLPDDAVSAITSELLQQVDLVTPNIPEAQRLVGWDEPVQNLGDMVRLAQRTADLCHVPNLLLKGGHLSVSREEVLGLSGDYKVIWDEGDEEEDTVEVLSRFGGKRGTELVVDILVEGAGETRKLFVGRKVDSTSTHGTGCTLSSVLACAWALRRRDHPDDDEKTLETICKTATAYTRSAIASAFPFGKGHGPLNHSHLTYPRALPPPSAHQPHPFLSHLIQSDLPLWKSYVRHPFVIQLGDGSLPRDCFEHYIVQDYHYLRHYARAHSLGAFKSDSFPDIQAFTDIAQHIAKESEMHVGYCQQFGISHAQLLATPESAACAAYSRYILDVGAQGDLLDLYVALASCLIGYGEVALWLRNRVATGQAKLEENLYRRWMEDYSSPAFLGAVERGIENLERRVKEDPPSGRRLERLTGIWKECVRLERDFWEMGLRKMW